METISEKRSVEGGVLKGDLSVVSVIEHLIRKAHGENASDIHIDPVGDGLSVRFRVDGMLHDAYRLSPKLHTEIIARLKILAGLRTDEHYAPHDGRFRFAVTDILTIDIRVSIAPTYYGENAMLRLLIPFRDSDTLKDLGFSRSQQTSIERAITKPHGLILTTGPTGSGKTTTLYAFIRLLNTRDRSIVAIEDPIEYSIPGINQIQVNTQSGLSFSQGLRSILRQDPNIIMVGEIRDAETAALAINAALTGHLVLSTLHANSAAAVLPRLLDLKIEPYLIAATINLIIAQRLVRRICVSCKESYAVLEIEKQALSELLPHEKTEQKYYRGTGCVQCNQTGYQSRIGIYEVLPVEGAIREALGNKHSTENIRTQAIRDGMIPIVRDGYEKAVTGITSLEEILRVQYE